MRNSARLRPRAGVPSRTGPPRRSESGDFLIGRAEPKPRGNGPVGRARRVLERLSRLPRHRQQKIIDVVEALVAHTGSASE
jgi:hypothetical protein